MNDFPDMPERLHFISDGSGNTMQVGDDISPEEAFGKISEGYDVQITTYVRQQPRIVSRKST